MMLAIMFAVIGIVMLGLGAAAETAGSGEGRS